MVSRKSTIERYIESKEKKIEEKKIASLKWKDIRFINNDATFSLFEWFILDEEVDDNWFITVSVKSMDKNFYFEWEMKVDFNRLKFKK